MQTNLNKISQDRVYPLTLSLHWGFAVINLLLGIGLFTLYHTTVPLAVANILTYDQWGIVFFLLGVITTWFLVTHRPNLVRKTQLVGVTLKAIWLIALIMRCFIAPQTIIITLVWGFFTYVQMMLYIHFGTQPGPRVTNGDK
jgi:hypothetical protein